MVAKFVHMHNNLKWRPPPRPAAGVPCFSLMRADEVAKILWYRGHAR